MILSRLSALMRAAVLLLYGALVLANPDIAARGFGDGCALCLYRLLPALFPFFVICSAVARLLGTKNAQGITLVLCWLGGYAVCARLVRDLYETKRLTQRQAQMLLVLGCCSGPGFVIGSVGGQMLGSVLLGSLLYGLQLASNLIAAIPAALFMQESSYIAPPSVRPIRYSSGISDDIRSAVDSSLCVCGCVIFFRMVYILAMQCLPLSPVFSRLACSVLEISAACADYAQAGGQEALYGTCLCMSILGLSVFTQLRALLPAGLSLRPLLFSRLVHVAAMQALVRFGMQFVPGTVTVFSNLEGRVIAMNRAEPDAAFAVFLFLCALLYKARRNNYND